MKTILSDLLEGKRLSVAESRSLMQQAVTEPVNEAQVAAMLAVFRLRGITIDELDGFVSALRELSIPVELNDFDLIDVCGTGGDHKNTFNVSTAVAFVLAGAGYKIAKHGNYSVSSSCGSSNVLEALGIKFTTDRDELRRRLEKAGVCFLHAPLFHPALKRVQAVRKELGVRTIFNVLGPLLNPASPGCQLSGVYELELARLYGYLLNRYGKRFGVVFTLDGYDEVSLTAPTKLVWHGGVKQLEPRHFGFEAIDGSALLAGSSVEACARMLRGLLEGNGTAAQESVVAANAGLAMWCKEGRGELSEYVARARESIRSKAALESLKISIEG